MVVVSLETRKGSDLRVLNLRVTRTGFLVRISVCVVPVSIEREVHKCPSSALFLTMSNQFGWEDSLLSRTVGSHSAEEENMTCGSSSSSFCVWGTCDMYGSQLSMSMGKT